MVPFNCFSLEAVAAREADDEEDDKDENQHDYHDDDLHLEVLPPHLAAKLLACLVKLVSLRMQIMHVRAICRK